MPTTEKSQKTWAIWLRVIRVRFLLASVIAVALGLALSWWQTSQINILHAGLTMAGVLALHVSVDLLNDYWDFRRGIDNKTKRTKMSGGTGVLPEGLLKPIQVYKAGIAFLILGTLIGSYFILIDGMIIAGILGFAILSIYFYSTKIVDSGLAEVFVAIKGTMIVLGTYYIQTSEIAINPIFAGIVVGVLSSLVLFITSFPDYDADKSKGRKTLVIVVGKKNATNIFWVFPVISFGVIVGCVVLGFFPVFSLITLVTIPIIIKSGRDLKTSFHDNNLMVPVMTKTLMFSRIMGALLVIGFLLNL